MHTFTRIISAMLGTALLFISAAVAADVAPATPKSREEALARLQGKIPDRYERVGVPLREVIVEVVDGAPVEFPQGKWFDRPTTFGFVDFTRQQILDALGKSWEFGLTWSDGKWHVARSFQTVSYPLANADGEYAESIAKTVREIIADSVRDWDAPAPALRAEYDAAGSAIVVGAPPRGQELAAGFIRAADVVRRRVEVEVFVIYGSNLPRVATEISVAAARKLIADISDRHEQQQLVRSGRVVVKGRGWGDVRLSPEVQVGAAERCVVYAQYQAEAEGGPYYQMSIDVDLLRPRWGAKTPGQKTFRFGTNFRLPRGHACVQGTIGSPAGNDALLVVIPTVVGQ